MRQAGELRFRLSRVRACACSALPRPSATRSGWGRFPSRSPTGSAFTYSCLFLKGKTLAYCIPVVQSLQAMQTKIQVSVRGVSLLSFIVRARPST